MGVREPSPPSIFQIPLLTCHSALARYHSEANSFPDYGWALLCKPNSSSLGPDADVSEGQR